MYGKIAEHDEGEHDAVFGLALGRCADELDKGGAPQPGFLKARTGRNWPVWWGAGRSRRLPFSVGDAVLQSLLFVNVVPEEGSVEREVPTEASTGVADAQGLHPLAPEFPLRLLHLQNRGSSVSSSSLSDKWHYVRPRSCGIQRSAGSRLLRPSQRLAMGRTRLSRV